MKKKKKFFLKKLSYEETEKNLHDNAVIVFCRKMSYNYEKVSLSGNN